MRAAPSCRVSRQQQHEQRSEGAAVPVGWSPERFVGYGRKKGNLEPQRANRGGLGPAAAEFPMPRPPSSPARRPYPGHGRSAQRPPGSGWRGGFGLRASQCQTQQHDLAVPGLREDAGSLQGPQSGGTRTTQRRQHGCPPEGRSPVVALHQGGEYAHGPPAANRSPGSGPRPPGSTTSPIRARARSPTAMRKQAVSAASVTSTVMVSVRRWSPARPETAGRSRTAAAPAAP